MKIAIVTAAAAILMLPWASDNNASAQTASQQTVKKKKTTAAQPAPQRVSPSGNSAHDVYVNGVYVGSDPDPRIRWSLERDSRGGYGFNN